MTPIIYDFPAISAAAAKLGRDEALFASEKTLRGRSPPGSPLSATQTPPMTRREIEDEIN